MPIYEYRCQKCGARFDLLMRSMADRQAVICPQCGSEAVEKAVSLCAAGSRDRPTASASCTTGAT